MPTDAPLDALRSARAKVIDTLTEHFAHDHLDLEEFERRLGEAHRAESVAAIERLASDLPAIDTAATAAPTTSIVLADAPPRGRTLAVFGSVERRGGWTPARALEARAVFGTVELDFREAHFAPGVTELHVSAIFGTVEIVVPPWLAVETEGAGLFGSFEHLHRAPAAPDPDVPTLRVRGTAIFGSVEVVTRLAREVAGASRGRLPPG